MDNIFNNVFNNTITTNKDKYLENINILLQPTNNHKLSVYSNNFIFENKKKMKGEIDVLNKKLKFVTTQLEVNEKENQQLVNENKILKTNLDILMRRYGLMYKTV